MRHDEKTSVGRAKVLSGGDTGYRLADVNKVLGCLVVQTVEHHEAELECDKPRSNLCVPLTVRSLHLNKEDTVSY